MLCGKHAGVKQIIACLVEAIAGCLVVKTEGRAIIGEIPGRVALDLFHHLPCSIPKAVRHAKAILLVKPKLNFVLAVGGCHVLAPLCMSVIARSGPRGNWVGCHGDERPLDGGVSDRFELFQQTIAGSAHVIKFVFEPENAVIPFLNMQVLFPDMLLG